MKIYTSGDQILRTYYPATYGVVADGTTDNDEALLKLWNAIVASGEAAHVIIPPGVIGFTDAQLIPSNVVVDVYGEFKALARGPSNLDCCMVPRIGAKNVLVRNLRVDLNSIPGMNGFISRIGAKDCRFIGGTIKNGNHDKGGAGGGRGFIVESASTSFVGQGAQVRGVSVKDCYMGFGVRGGEAAAQQDFFIDSIRVENAEVLCALFGNTAGYPHDTQEMSGLITNIQARNVGLNTEYTNDGGVIVADRGCHVMLRNINVRNDASYGTIPSVIHGEFYDVDAEVSFTGDCDTLVDFSSWKESDTPPAAENSTSRSRFAVRHVEGTAGEVVTIGSSSDAYLTDVSLKAVTDVVTSDKPMAAAVAFQTDLNLEVENLANNAKVIGPAASIGTSTTFSGNASAMKIFGGFNLGTALPIASGGTAAVTKGAAKVALGLSRSDTIANDGVLDIALGSSSFAMQMSLSFNQTTHPAALLALRAASSSNFIKTIASVLGTTGSITVNTTTGVLTGTTGVVGVITVSVTDGHIWIENRSGVTVTAATALHSIA